MRIKKNDTVVVLTGKDRGKKGRVMRVYPGENKVLIEKINYRTVFLRRSQQNPQGGIAKVEGKVDISNVQLVDPRTNKPTRVGYTFLADGTKHRLAKKTGEIL
jgi:large subunit ribosomal protein L24